MARAARVLSESERLDWLCLSRSENVGPATFRDLLGIYGSAGAALAALPQLARRGGRRSRIKLFPRAAGEDELAALAQRGGRLIALSEPEYPLPLAATVDAPPLIAVLGHAHILDRQAVAIVGARNASALGGRFARELAVALGAEGFTIVSGLARGIDAQAHSGALETGTVAVVAGGVDVIYPRENTDLYHAIVDAGAVVSEQPLGTVPQGRHFPRRNRIISGLALAVVVVEASMRSGSLITARCGLEQGREVLAVPGSPLDPRHRGTNRLIRDGAAMCESAEDVIAAVVHMTPPALHERAGAAPADRPAADLDLDAGAREKVVELLGPSPVAVDEVIRQCQLTPAEVLTVILELELAGRLGRHPGGQVSLLMDSG